MDWSLSDDGTAFVNSRLYRPGVGEIESPSVFYPRAMSASGLMAGFPIADGSVATSFARVSLATVDGVLATYDFESFGGGFGIFDLSDSGWIVGTFGVWGSAVPARILPSGELEILEVPEGMTGYALAVNNSGQTAGRLQHVTGPGPTDPVSVFWDTDGTLHEITDSATLGNHEPIGVSDLGEVMLLTVGSSPMRWTVDGGLVPISIWTGDGGFTAWSMNELGHVVGSAGFTTAWVFIDGRYSILDSNLIESSGWRLTGAFASNKRGQIFGTGNLNGVGTCFLATPTGWCIADMTTTGSPTGGLGSGVPDGEITGTDLSFFVNGWIIGDSVADVTTRNAPEGDPLYGEPDGIVTGADIQYYVNMWVSGCSG